MHPQKGACEPRPLALLGPRRTLPAVWRNTLAAFRILVSDSLFVGSQFRFRVSKAVTILSYRSAVRRWTVGMKKTSARETHVEADSRNGSSKVKPFWLRSRKQVSLTKNGCVCRGETLASVLDGIWVSSVASEARKGVGLSIGRARDAGGSCPQASRGSASAADQGGHRDVAFQRGAGCGCPGAPGHGTYRGSRAGECNGGRASKLRMCLSLRKRQSRWTRQAHFG